MVQPQLAPNWHISEWLNSPKHTDLQAQRGRVVVACAFQMLCTGCVSRAIEGESFSFETGDFVASPPMSQCTA